MDGTSLTDQLFPADIENILMNYGDLLQSYTNLGECESLLVDFKRTLKRLEVIFPLKQHLVHGITGLHAIERYDDAGFVKEYQYMWKIILPKQGVQFNHISSWGNEKHDAPDTKEVFVTETEPHHHHFVPGNRKERKENWHVRSLEQAFEFIKPYIESGHPYAP